MRDEKGFTLVEVLIAATLTAVVMGAVLATFAMAERARKEAGGALLDIYEGRKAMDALRRELEALKGRVRVTDREYFGKQASGVSFAAFSPETGVLSTISYYAKEEEGKLVLVKKRSLLGRPAQSAVLLEDIGELLIEAGSGGKWFRTWQEEAAPESIRVSLKLAQGGTPLTLSETVSTRIGKPL
jgi:prepilin-type N-terminal cleavage/methylation domain-containing protein